MTAPSLPDQKPPERRIALDKRLTETRTNLGRWAGLSAAPCPHCGFVYTEAAMPLHLHFKHPEVTRARR